MTDHSNQASGIGETVVQADQLRGLCSVITKIARADLESHLRNHGAGISAIEHGVIRHLSRGVTSMAEISRLMGIAPSTLVYAVDGLTKKRLVKRGKDPTDRRREPLLLEKKGAELFDAFPKMDAGSTLVSGLEGLSATKRRRLIALLEELVKEMTGTERPYVEGTAAQGRRTPR